MGRANKILTKEDKVVHVDANGRRHYFLPYGGKQFLCKGKVNTCIKVPKRGGLCRACGGGLPKCKHPGCTNNRQRRGLCVIHGGKHPRCTHVTDDGTPCPSQAQKDGLCRRHGGRSGMCPCGKERRRCSQCNPLGNLVNILGVQIRQCSPNINNGKPRRKPPPCLGCTGEEYDKWLEEHFQDGMDWNNYGHGEGKWQVDHKLAFFDETNPVTTKEEILRRFHYTNTHPMWSKDNMSKGIK